MSSASGRYGAGGEDQMFLYPYHHHENLHAVFYHVPQHSRREKLRFPPENSPAQAVTSSSLPPLYQDYSLARLVDDGSCLHEIQQQQGFSLTLSPPPQPPPAPVGPLGPFTGYSAVLNRSRFLEPARQLLEEICDLGRGGAVTLICSDPSEMLPVACEMDSAASGPATAGPDEQQWKKAKLISMMDEACTAMLANHVFYLLWDVHSISKDKLRSCAVIRTVPIRTGIYRRYRLYYQQVQTVMASFEAVAGLNTAAPFVSMALKSMAKHFRCLKNALSNQLNRINKALGKEDLGKSEISGSGLMINSISCSQQIRGSGSTSSRQPHVWRPQRGLPERAVAVLRAWLFEHFLHPYPTDADKQMLAKQTGLSRNQVSNWFINARVRVWKPMVEEIHNLEMRQQQIKSAQTDHNEKNINPAHDMQLSAAASQPSASSTATSSSNHDQYSCSRRRPLMNSNADHHHELSYFPHHINEDAYSLDYLSVNGGNHSSNGVSLTLGLHQNTAAAAVCQLPEPLPLMHVARRLGLEDCSDPYVRNWCV
ncbi:BEL1-like homeodomain protein 9 [Apostasia shenzhenica]|uniref:BEL1-like homeodomain protein 9 n=1 Tax=Apostasia shenzhenica TaxID=1088818 RepID=A0A2I0AAA1_9ASPA|nr:BEL1-like homeodomain protein 9 [Apostasia shenzhenica]